MKNRKFRYFFVALISCLPFSGCNKNKGQTSIVEEPRVMHNYSVYDEGVDFSDSLWEAPEFIYDESMDQNGCKGIYIRSDHKGIQSYAFGYLAIPDNPENKKLPGVVILHGGGGTAYHEWARLWKDRGYVALALDLEGHVPYKTSTIVTPLGQIYEKSKYEAPSNVAMTDGNTDMSKTWLHYACRTAIIANSFLHNLDCIDKEKIGITGISWGGYITSIVTGYDDRLAFSIPIYITVGCKGTGTPFDTHLKGDSRFEIFDKIEPFTLVNTPIKFIMSDIDEYANVYKFSEVIKQTKNGTLAIMHNYGHSHQAYNLEEGLKFADDVLEKKNNVKLTYEDSNFVINIPESKKVKKLYYTYTEESTINKNTMWFQLQVNTNKIVNGKLPIETGKEVKYYYYSIIDEKACQYSGTIQKNF